ncbi:MAG TPA: N-acetylmuramoyl-L-alanine amidase [Candidatus Acidoferrum sp.]|nr:N-acetylmuramoyl-L-alanine amidase [Candidatus Acidoferrum sp.]HXJ32350.1 N-acetylmuramoyl-L-alanine amidase [Gemmatimonadales bacterium]
MLPEPVWKGSPNFWPGRQGLRPIAIVIHTMGGSLAGTDGWFANPSSQVSAHTGVGLQGERHRYVRFEDRAWANGILEPGNLWAKIGGASNPNNFTLSIETEDLGDPTMPVDELQYNAVLAEAKAMQATHPGMTWLLRHADISPASRRNCPGDRWVASGRLLELADALGLKRLS